MDEQWRRWQKKMMITTTIWSDCQVVYAACIISSFFSWQHFYHIMLRSIFSLSNMHAYVFFFILSQCRSQQNSDIICLKQAKINATTLQRFCWFSNDVNVLANNVAWNEFDLIWYLLSDCSRLTATTKNHEKSSLKLIACFPPDAQYKLSICCTRGCFSE